MRSVFHRGWLVFASCFHSFWLAIHSLPALGCPLCDPIARTISDDLGDSAIAVTGRVSAELPKAAGEIYPTWRIEVVDRLKGHEFLDERPMLEVYAQDQLEVGSLVFVMAYEQAPPNGPLRSRLPKLAANICRKSPRFHAGPPRGYVRFALILMRTTT